MDLFAVLQLTSALAPIVLMGAAAVSSWAGGATPGALWKRFSLMAALALLCAAVSLALAIRWVAPSPLPLLPWLAESRLGAWMAVLVQLLGTTVGVFSSRYMQGEPGQSRFAAALAGVLAAVHLLLLADHWLVLIAAWALIGAALQHLLCFYSERPFARLAAHKKRIADRLADVMLLIAAALIWRATGSGSLTDLSHYLAQGIEGPHPIALQIGAACLVLAVILRTALFPVHGWLIQVMEAPTPVSALMHAGVVNLGGFVLIRFAPLLGAAAPARWILVIVGLGTALLAGFVMLTRVSIKVRLAWSTVAQMGFMLLECGLGLYSLAALHLIGHSLYKAHAFLSASTVVRQSTLRRMRGTATASALSVAVAPVLAACGVALVQWLAVGARWPWWWSGVLALAWAPLLWWPVAHEARSSAAMWRAAFGFGLVGGLTTAGVIAHALPFGVNDEPDALAGIFTLLGMGGMYLCLVTLQLRPQRLTAWRRWSYAGFYVDEFYTRIALRLWPARWIPAAAATDDARIARAAFEAPAK